MTEELSKELVCLLLRNGIQFWLEKDRATNLESKLSDKTKPFFDLDGNIVNKSDVTGIFAATVIEEMTRRKNGQWFCKEGYWHDRGEKCEDCWSKNAQKRAEEYRRANNLGEYASP